MKRIQVWMSVHASRCCSFDQLDDAQGVEIIQINEDEKEFGIDRMKELVTT